MIACAFHKMSLLGEKKTKNYSRIQQTQKDSTPKWDRDLELEPTRIRKKMLRRTLLRHLLTFEYLLYVK